MFLSTTPNINITKLFCELHSMFLLLPTATILEISVASEQRRGKLCHSISIQSTYFVHQLSVENVRVLGNCVRKLIFVVIQLVFVWYKLFLKGKSEFRTTYAQMKDYIMLTFHTKS